MFNRFAAAAALLLTAACGAAGLGGPEPAAAPEEFESLPEISVCVVDRSTTTGLSEIPARRAPDGTTVLLVAGEVVPLERVHAPGVMAGYAAEEPWFAADSISFRGADFVKVQGERRIAADQVNRIGDFRAIPVFAGAGDEAPFDAVYLPTRPGCVFQAYIRSDLM